MMEVSLEQLIDRYKISVGSMEFWPPYWINWDVPPYFLNAPYRGKASPDQLQIWVKRYLASGTYDEAAAIRVQLKQAGIGVDCSGFVYHTLNAYLKHLGHHRLARYLYVSGEDIRAAIDRHPTRLSLAPNTSLLRNVPLSAFCRVLRKDPVMLTDVKKLVSPLSSVRIDGVKDIRVADMIKMTSRYGDHIGIVTRVGSGVLVYASSDDDEKTPGGIRFHEVVLSEPDRSLEFQQWDQRAIFNPEQTDDAVYRLRTLA